MRRKPVTLILILSFYSYVYNVNAYSFGIMDPRVKITRRAAGYNLYMPENNHEADFRRALFTIYDYDQEAAPPYLKDDPGFSYSIEKYFNSYVMYSNSSFDYETNLRYHVINLGVGAHEYKTLTLLIDNIDDEPPRITCPDNLLIPEDFIYKPATSPLKCIVEDPDGFLNLTTFHLKGENKDKFEFLLPDKIDDMAQSVEIVIVNKVKFAAVDMYANVTVETKDGANHNTVSKADVTLQIQIIPKL